MAQGENLEIIVADGGSTDGTVGLATEQQVRVLAVEGGRAHQMNRGAATARGEILLFLHADTLLPPEFDRHIRRTLSQPGVVAGAFALAIDAPDWGLRWVEWGVQLRSRWLQLPYGDQGLFMGVEVFRQLGGFPPIPIMEDFELVRRLRRQGRVAIAPAQVLTSGRRWQTLGILRTTLVNQVMILAYGLGVNPHRLAEWYRRQPVRRL